MRSKRGRRARKVYIDEVASGARPIEAVGTVVAAFVGLAPEAPFGGELVVHNAAR